MDQDGLVHFGPYSTTHDSIYNLWYCNYLAQILPVNQTHIFFHIKKYIVCHYTQGFHELSCNPGWINHNTKPSYTLIFAVITIITSKLEEIKTYKLSLGIEEHTHWVLHSLNCPINIATFLKLCVYKQRNYLFSLVTSNRQIMSCSKLQ